MDTNDKNETTGWFLKPKNGRLLFWIVCAICAVLVALDLFYHKHVHYSWEGWFGFYGFFGFIACFVLVLAAKEMRKILMRDEDYYDR